MPLPNDASSRSDPASRDDPTTALVEVGAGMAVLFADRPPSEMELIPFSMMGTETTKRLTDRLAIGAGLVNTGVQGVQGALPAQGLVRLAPQTLEALKTAVPVQSGGWNLGVLTEGHGFSHVIRWAPATSAQAATLLSSLGPAAALLSLQMQLASVSRRVDENLELTQEVLKELRQDHWNTLLGLYETTVRAVEEAQMVGFVNQHIYGAVKMREADLRAERHVFDDYVKGHVKALSPNARSRNEYLQGHGEEIIADAHGLLMAEGSWFRFRVLRAASIAYDEDHAAENQQLLTSLVETTRQEHDEAMGRIAELLEALERRARLVAALPGRRSFKLGAGRGTDRHDIAPLAEALAEKVAVLRNRPHRIGELPQPALAVFKDGTVPKELLRILQYVLPEGTRLLALADVNDTEHLIHGNAYLGVTPEHFFLSSQSGVNSQGIIERQIPLADIRYVRTGADRAAGLVLDVITKDENIRISFDAWAQEGERLKDARRLGTLLASAMNIPDEERCSDPLLPSPVVPDRMELPGDPQRFPAPRRSA